MSKRRNRALIGLLGGLSAFGPLSIDVYLPGLPRMTHDLHASTSQAQLTVTACLIGLGVGQLAAGPISDMMGRRRPLLVGLTLFVVASLGCAVAPTVWPLIGVRFIQGVAGAAGLAIARAVVRDRNDPAEATRLLAVLFSINSAVPIFAPVVGGQLLHFTDWRGVFVTLAIGGGLLLGAAVLIIHESLVVELRRPRERGGSRRVVSELVADRFFVGCVLTSGLGMASMLAYIAGSPFVLQDIHGLSPQTYSLVFGANACGILGATRISMGLTARLGPYRLMRLGAGVCAAGSVFVLIVVLGHLGLAALLVGLFVTVASVGLIAPNAAALAMAGHPSIAGTASGLFGMTGFLIGAAVAPLVGIAGSHTAVPMGIAMAAMGVSALLTARFLAVRDAAGSPGALVDSPAIPASHQARP